jgi:predicted amidohydrolase YtcJ
VLQDAAGDLVAGMLPAPTHEDRAAALRSAIAEANALGITSAQTAADSPDSLRLYDGLRRAGDLTLRIYAALPVAAPLTDADLERLDATRTQYPDDPLLKTGALSISLDGPIATRQAAMLEPYEGRSGPRDRSRASRSRARETRPTPGRTTRSGSPPRASAR